MRVVDALLRSYAAREAADVVPFVAGPRVLDLGAGEGWVTAALTRRGFTTCGADVGPFARVAVPYVVYDGTRLPFADAAFETTLLLLTLHHCVQPERVLDEAVRVTRARLIITESVFRTRLDRFWLDLLDGRFNRLRHGGRMPAPLGFRRAEHWHALFESRGLTPIAARWLGGRLERLIHHPRLFVLEMAARIDPGPGRNPSHGWRGPHDARAGRGEPARPARPSASMTEIPAATPRPGVVAVAVMAKAPSAGAVKTRLCPPLAARQAAALARCFLRDRIAHVRGLSGASPVIAYTPTSARELFERLAPDFALIAQDGDDLGARMRSLLAGLLRSGARAAIAVGTDTPTLPAAVLQQAVDVVASGDVDLVLGPAEDGGYYLVGVRADHPALFADVPWSTSAVLEITLRRARLAGLRSALLPRWFDVDTPADLDRLRAALVDDPHAAPATHRFFAGHDACRRRARSAAR